MPASDAPPTAHKATRSSSIRHSLGFASVGKALADVMNKDGKDSDKGSKRAVKESRRSSAVHLAATASRGAREVTSPEAKVDSPDSKTITRRRGSTARALAKPADAASPPAVGVVTRSSSLRPRPGTSSGLPKYRPKSIIQDAPPKKSDSPTSSRRTSGSSEKVPDSASPSDETDNTPSKARAFKVDLPKSSHFTPPATPTKNKPSTPTKGKPSTPTKGKPSTPSKQASPSRPTRLAKVTSSSAAPSSTSSSSSASIVISRTPKTRDIETPAKKTPTNHSPSPSRSLHDSSVARHTRSKSASDAVANMSHITEADSEEDSDEEDVAMLLLPSAQMDLSAPTPAMPRQVRSSRQRLTPRTPTRPALPTRSQLSYLSPLPPDDESSPSSRPNPPSGGAPRGSILSWEQIAQEASITLGDDEIENMISDVPAPFRSGAASPLPSSMLLDIPESPCLSALNSPSDFGSISQVLLPDVTPSPAVHNRRVSRGPFDVPVADGAIVTLLRMQLESAEHMAKERLIQLQALEEEIHNVKQERQERMRDAAQLSMQVGTMENQLRSSLEARERSEAEQATYIAVLESQLKEAVAARDKIAKEQGKVQSKAKSLHSAKSKWDCAATAHATSLRWKTVGELAESEMETLESDQQMLAVLLLQLEQARKKVSM